MEGFQSTNSCLPVDEIEFFSMNNPSIEPAMLLAGISVLKADFGGGSECCNASGGAFGFPMRPLDDEEAGLEAVVGEAGKV